MEANMKQKYKKRVGRNLVFKLLQNKAAERHIHYNKD